MARFSCDQPARNEKIIINNILQIPTICPSAWLAITIFLALVMTSRHNMGTHTYLAILGIIKKVLPNFGIETHISRNTSKTRPAFSN